jgi:tRNA1(Val) A37 N6-methylase TrmN6
MPNEYFSFKQFTIRQDRCAMKVGTDGVLLGVLAPVLAPAENSMRILDIGTGTGLVAIMLTQRTGGGAQISAVEIDCEAAVQARENVSDGDACLKAVQEDLLVLLEQERKILSLAAEIGDDGTQDLFAPYVSSQEKLLWMLNAYLNEK